MTFTPHKILFTLSYQAELEGRGMQQVALGGGRVYSFGREYEEKSVYFYYKNNLKINTQIKMQ